jgi:hypothetical protein
MSTPDEDEAEVVPVRSSSAEVADTAGSPLRPKPLPDAFPSPMAQASMGARAEKTAKTSKTARTFTSAHASASSRPVQAQPAQRHERV